MRSEERVRKRLFLHIVISGEPRRDFIECRKIEAGLLFWSTHRAKKGDIDREGKRK